LELFIVMALLKHCKLPVTWWEGDIVIHSPDSEESGLSLAPDNLFNLVVDNTAGGNLAAEGENNIN
jgi:hypothetical protein